MVMIRLVFGLEEVKDVRLVGVGYVMILENLEVLRKRRHGVGERDWSHHRKVSFFVDRFPFDFYFLQYFLRV